MTLASVFLNTLDNMNALSFPYCPTLDFLCKCGTSFTEVICTGVMLSVSPVRLDSL